MYFNKEHKEKVESRGDGYIYIGSYHTNEITLDGKNKKYNGNYIRVKCPYCEKEYDIQLHRFNNGSKCSNCCNFYENSFAYYIQQELKEPLNKYWDWEKNDLNPYCISKQSHKKIKFKMIKTKTCHDFYQNKTYIKKKINSKDSFGQYLIDTYGDNAIKKYWSSKNTLDPFNIAPQSNKKVWIYCQNKDYHNDNGGYLISPGKFKYNKRCPYCSTHHGKVHQLDSFGALYPEKAKYWSPNNKKSPFEVTPKSNYKYKFICEKCDNEFERRLSDINRNDTGVVCRRCQGSKLETKTKHVLDKYNVKYEREKTFDNLYGLKNRLLRFDFYLPDYNLLIECQGEQHESWQKTWMSKEDFERQLEHDKRKREYAENNDINLLEIWYYDIDDIEEILNRVINNK